MTSNLSRATDPRHDPIDGHCYGGGLCLEEEAESPVVNCDQQDSKPAHATVRDLVIQHPLVALIVLGAVLGMTVATLAAHLPLAW